MSFFFPFILLVVSLVVEECASVVGVGGDPHVLRQGIEHPVSKLCIKIG